MHHANPIRVIVADDHEMIRHTLKLCLLVYEDIQLVGEVANGAEAILMAGKLQPDVILLDVAMPVMNGITAVGLIRQRYPRIKIIMLGSFKEEDMVTAALNKGANAYLLKNFSMDRLVEVIRTVHCNGSIA